MANLKGTYFAATVRALKAKSAEVGALLPAHLQHYLQENVLITGWYPEADNLELLKVLIRVSNIPDADPWAFLGRTAAKRDMRTTYSVFLKEGDPGGTFARLVNVWSMGHDSGTMVAILDGDAGGRLELRGGYHAMELCRLHTAFFATAIEMTGARQVQVRHDLCSASGGELCRWQGSWQSP